MTFGQLLFWIFVAFLIYLLFKFSGVILIIAIVVLVIYYLANMNRREGYSDVLQYPIQFAPANLTNASAGNVYLDSQGAVNTGHSDYFYMPIQNYLEKQVNGYGFPTQEFVPPSTSEYCVNKHLLETRGNLSEAIRRCQVPGSISEGAY